MQLGEIALESGGRLRGVAGLRCGLAHDAVDLSLDLVLLGQLGDGLVDRVRVLFPEHRYVFGDAGVVDQNAVFVFETSVAVRTASLMLRCAARLNAAASLSRVIVPTASSML